MAPDLLSRRAMPAVWSLLVLLFVACPILVARRLGQASRVFPHLPVAAFLPGRGGGRVWVHVDRTEALLPLHGVTAELRRLRPNLSLIVSAPPGPLESAARGCFREAEVVVPLAVGDAPFLARVVRAIRPDVVLVEDSGQLPRLTRAVAADGAWLVSVAPRAVGAWTARLRWLRARWAPTRPADLAFVETGADREAQLRQGRRPESVHLVAAPPAPARAPPPAPRKAPLLVAGGTDEADEALLLAACTRLRETFPSLELWCAPRRPQRAETLAALPAVRSGWARVLTGLEGTLAAYREATLVYVGGGFSGLGRRSVLVPAAQARPVLFGPHMNHCRDALALLAGRGGLPVTDGEHLYRVLYELLARPEDCAALGVMAHETVARLASAESRRAQLIARICLPSTGRSRRRARAARDLGNGPSRPPPETLH